MGYSARTHTRHHTRRGPGVPGSAKRRFFSRGHDMLAGSSEGRLLSTLRAIVCTRYVLELRGIALEDFYPQEQAPASSTE